MPKSAGPNVPSPVKLLGSQKGSFSLALRTLQRQKLTAALPCIECRDKGGSRVAVVPDMRHSLWTLHFLTRCSPARDTVCADVCKTLSCRHASATEDPGLRWAAFKAGGQGLGVLVWFGLREKAGSAGGAVIG